MEFVQFNGAVNVANDHSYNCSKLVFERVAEERLA